MAAQTHSSKLFVVAEEIFFIFTRLLCEQIFTNAFYPRNKCISALEKTIRKQRWQTWDTYTPFLKLRWRKKKSICALNVLFLSWALCITHAKFAIFTEQKVLLIKTLLRLRCRLKHVRQMGTRQYLPLFFKSYSSVPSNNLVSYTLCVLRVNYIWSLPF